jgi:hypothetical protein
MYRWLMVAGGAPGRASVRVRRVRRVVRVPALVVAARALAPPTPRARVRLRPLREGELTPLEAWPSLYYCMHLSVI